MKLKDVYEIAKERLENELSVEIYDDYNMGMRDTLEWICSCYEHRKPEYLEEQ